MNTNALANEILASLSVLHPRVTRNKSPQTPVNPYVVFMLESSLPSERSVDYYLHIDIYEDPNSSVIAMETLADTIQDAFDDRVIRTNALNAHFILEQRQYISNSDLVTAQMINLRFIVRAYFL